MLKGGIFVLLLRWLLRCRAQHSARIVILVIRQFVLEQLQEDAHRRR